MKVIVLRYDIANYENDVLPLASEMKKSGVTVENPPDCVWLAAKNPATGEVCGVCAVSFTKNSARFKSVYVRPDARGYGTIYVFLKYADDIAKDRGIRKITGFFNGNSVHAATKHGYVVKSVNSHGVSFAERAL